MGYWAKPGLDRQQTMLMYPTLDESVSADHPVRILDEILQARDWSLWDCQYSGRRGQPAIPPRVMAGAIVYGLMRRIRSSRQLEYACGHNIDFLWLVEGRSIDHDTFCKFRTRFKEPLKKLFRQVGQVAMNLGLIRLLEVAFDGTRVKANASRCHTWTAEKVEALLAELETQFGQMLSEADAADSAEAPLWGDDAQSKLPAELADARKRQAKLRELLEQLQAADAARKQDGIDPQKNPAQLPMADSDSKVMPNKEGGYAPNYTPTAAVDGTSDFIVDCDVISGPNEQNQLVASVDRIEENFGRKPEHLLADAAFGTTANLQGMDERGVDFYTPVESPLPQEGNPAKRDDPRQPVAAEDWPKLPRNNKKKLAKSCFVYDEAADQCYCPMGRAMPYEETKKFDRSSGAVKLRMYRCKQCTGCPLASQCLDPHGKHGRTVGRDGSERLRDQVAKKLATEAGRKTYNQRMHIAETSFAILKGILGVRQFLLRGLEKVRTEWLWVCTAYNLKKLIQATARLRAVAATVPTASGK